MKKPEVEIYTSILCGYCYRAKFLLKQKQVAYKEIDVSFHPKKRQEMTARAKGLTSVPQIFIGGRYIGGCDDLFALDREGKLDSALIGK